jgi:hypothetical protein
MFKLHVVIVLLAGTSYGLKGAAILSDTFSYSDGILQTVSADKWVGHSGATNQVDVSSGALNLTGTEGQDVNASLDGQPHSAAGGDRLYSSFKIKFTLPPSNNGSYFAHFKDSGGGFRGRIWALTNGASSGSFRLGIGSAAGTAPSMVHPMDLKLESEYLVVTRLIVSNAVSSLWINPASEDAANVATESGAAISISSYAFRQAAGIGTMVIDNLLVGTTFQDVVLQGTPIPTPIPAPAPAPTPPSITTHPQNQSVVSGESVVFAVVASGTEPLTYQWRFTGAEIPGATNSILTLTNATERAQGEYQVMARNSFGTATSVAVTLTVAVLELPAITAQPSGRTVKAGENANFSVAANGTTPLTYQWQFNGTDIPGANSATLALNAVTTIQAGRYTVKVSNKAGSTVSEAAALMIAAPIDAFPSTNVSTAKPPIIKFTNVLESLVRPGDLPANTFSELVLRPGERLTSHVRISDPENREFSWLINSNDLPSSVTWAVSESTRTNLNATLTFVPTPAEAGTNYVVILRAIGAGGTNHTAWDLYVPKEPEQGLVVTEFLANPTTVSTALHFNPLHRTNAPPNPSSNDEFIEIVNLSTKPLELLNWTISDSVQVRHRFTESFTIPSSNAVVIYGGPPNGLLPVLDVPAIAANESTVGLGLNNSGGDSIIIRNASSNLVGRVVYADVAANGSLTRYPEPNGGFVPHIMIATNYASPGRRNDGGLFQPPIPAATTPDQPALTEPAVIVPAPTEPAPVEPAVEGPISVEPSPSKPTPFSVTVSLKFPENMRLEWIAEPGRSYTVLRSPSPSGPFVPIAAELMFSHQNGQFEDKDWRTRPASFYRIGTP